MAENRIITTEELDQIVRKIILRDEKLGKTYHYTLVSVNDPQIIHKSGFNLFNDNGSGLRPNISKKIENEKVVTKNIIDSLDNIKLNPKLGCDVVNLFIPVFAEKYNFVAFFSIIPNLGIVTIDALKNFGILLERIKSVLREHDLHINEEPEWIKHSRKAD